MASEEMKQETKKTESKQETKKTESKQDTKTTEPKQSPEVKDLPHLPFPYKTCSLKVSIHCEGCKRKVKKILTSIEGVYRVDIDVKQHKVTVMGIIPPEILLKKLLKAGKNADLLPEIPDPVVNKPVIPKENKPVDPKDKKKKKKKEEKTEKNDEASSSGSDKPESEKPVAAGECDSGDGGKTSDSVKQEKNVVVKEKKSVPAESPLPADSPSPATEKKAEENGGDVGSGNIGKKKKKKGQKLTTACNPTDAPARTQSPPPPTITPAADQDRPFSGYHPLTNNNPPRHDIYPYAPTYYVPQIMYGVSYNVAHSPASVDGASYYTPPPPYSYAYMHPGNLTSDQNPYQSRPSDSFELFSDENPNGCSVM